MLHIERLVARIAGWIDAYLAAGAVVWAMEEDRRPDPNDLRRLGIDPSTCLDIGHG